MNDPELTETERRDLYETFLDYRRGRFTTAQPIERAVTRIVAARVAAARAEALQEVREGLTRGMHLRHDGEHWVSLSYVLDLLDRAVVSREPSEGDTP